MCRFRVCERFYVVTEANPKNLPVPDECAYYKEDAGKLLVGFFEPVAKPWAIDGIPEDAEFLTLPDDWEHIAPELEKALARVPLSGQMGIHTFFNGPESFTPDNRYQLGEAPELRNFYVAAGFNSIGIQSAGGAGKALSEWMAAGEPPFDLGDIDIRRMFPFQGNKTYLVTRVSETLGLLYGDHFPYRHETARVVFAIRRCTSGLRREAPASVRRLGAPLLVPAAGRPGRAARRRNTAIPGSGRTGFFMRPEEHRAVRTGAGLFDLTPFGKIRVEGADAEAVLPAAPRQRHRRRDWPHRLYPVAQRKGRHRGRPHRHPPVRDRVPSDHRLRFPAA